MSELCLDFSSFQNIRIFEIMKHCLIFSKLKGCVWVANCERYDLFLNSKKAAVYTAGIRDNSNDPLG